MTAVQAESMRGLGGWCGALFMAASKEFEPEEAPANGATDRPEQGDDAEQEEAQA